MLENLTAFDFVGIAGVVGCIVGFIAYNKMTSKENAEKVKSEIKSELLDKEQTKEIKRIEREIDDIKRTKQ